jgi:hypothetical protein
MIERQKKSKTSVTTVSVNNNKKKVDTTVDNNSGQEINNNINIKIQQPVEPAKKKKKRKYKKRIPKAVVDDFLNTLNAYTVEGGTDNGTSITDIKKLTEPEIIDLTNSLKVKISALKSSKEQEKLAPTQRLASQTTNYTQMPPRQSAGFQRTSLPAIQPVRTSLQQIEAPRSSLIPTAVIPEAPIPPSPIEQIPESPIEQIPESPIEISSAEIFYNTYYPNGIYTEIGKGRPTKEQLKQIITSNYFVTGINSKNKSDLALLFKKLYEESLPQPPQEELTFDESIDLYEDYLQYLVDTNNRTELETQYKNALGKEALSTDTNIQLLNQIEGLTDYVPILATDNFFKYKAMKKVVQPEAPVIQPTEVLPTEISPEDLKLINIAEDEENLETLQSIYKKYFGKNYEYKRENIGQRVFDIIQELKKPKSLKSDEIIPELTYETITEYTPETCKDKPGRKLLGLFNPCLGEYENYLKTLIDVNNRNELNIQYEKAFGRSPPATSNNVLLVNQIIEQTDYVPQLSNDNFYKYESLKKSIKPDAIVPEIVKSPPSAEDIEITRKLQILGPFYNRFYPEGKFKPLDDNRPSDDDLVSMIKLMDDTFIKSDLTRDVLQKTFSDEFIKYELKNRNINTDIQEGRSSNLTQAVQQRINEGNEVTIALLVTLASYDLERPEFIFQYNYVPELSDAEIAVYYETDGRKIVVGNRGSTTLEDWIDTDITLAFGKLKDGSARWSRTLQKIIAISNYNFDNNNDLFIFTGDSLGGSLAYEQAVYVHQNSSQFNNFDSYAITFNAGQGLPSSSQFFAFLKTNLFNDDWYKTHLLNFTVTGDVLSNVGRAVGSGLQIPVPWSVGNQPHNLQNFVKFNVDSYKDFVDSTQEPVIKKVIDKGIAEEVTEEKSGPDYTALGIAVGAGVLVGGLAGLLTKNPQVGFKLGQYSTTGIATLTRGYGFSGSKVIGGALVGGTLGSVEEGIRQNLIAGSKPQYFGSLPQQYKAPKSLPPPRLGSIRESQVP